MNENRLHEEENLEIDLLELMYVLLQRWWMIAIAAIVGAITMMGITAFLITPQYKSQTMLYILNKTTSVTSIADLQIGTAITNDFIVIAKSKPVIDGAIEIIEEQEGITFSRSEVLSMLSVSKTEDTRILIISATSANPVHACIVANAVAEKTASRMSEIMKSDPPTTVERAEVSAAPISPSMTRNMILGFLIGAVLVCVMLTIQYILNDTIKTEEHIIRYLDVPTLAVVPYIKGKERKREELERLKDKGNKKSSSKDSNDEEDGKIENKTDDTKKKAKK